MSENIKVKIIDSIMGSGKTSYAIQRMNEDVENNYIYITPFLSEVQRIKDNCTSRKFYEPFNVGSGKLDSLHNLLKDGKNIASTHALFRLSNEVTKDLIQANNYVLILDEVLRCANPDTQRSAATRALSERASVVIALTGTPTAGRGPLDWRWLWIEACPTTR